jgi:CrcB protein
VGGVIAAAFVALAAVGTLARAVLGRRLNRSFPAGTLLVNVTGSFALGLLHNAAPGALTALGTGGLGAYTTFSAFARDASILGGDRRWSAAVGYVAASVVLAVAAAGAGMALSP